MNMTIATAPVAVNTASLGTQTSASNGSVAAGGFAGLLVQAINGGTNPSFAGNALLPLGLTALFGQLEQSEQDGQSEDLMQLLSKLLEQLRELEEGDSPTDEQLEALAALLVPFQGVVQQLAFDQWTGASDANAEDGPAFLQGSQPQMDSQSANAGVVAAMRQTLQQLTTLLNNDLSAVSGASPLSAEMNTLLRTLQQQLQAVKAEGQSQSTLNIQLSQGEAMKTNEAVVTVTKEAASQLQSATVEINRSVTPLRDPVWRFQIVEASNVSADSLNGNVSPVLTASESSDAGSQQAWTLLSQDAKATEPLQAKTVLPAQVPVHQFAQQVDKLIVKPLLLAQAGGVMEAKLSLTPEHLGQVDVRIVMQNGQLTAQFVAENGMARELIESQMAQLRSSLQAQGLNVERLEVVQQPSSASNASFLQQDHRQQASGENGKGAKGKNNGGTFDESLGFEEELDLKQTIRDLAYGSRLNVTA